MKKTINKWKSRHNTANKGNVTDVLNATKKYEQDGE